MRRSRKQPKRKKKLKVAVIACKWHPMTAIENAARDGLEIDEDITILPVSCTGVVTTSMVLKLFARGMDGVLVLGCSEGECHYFGGSDRCAQIIEETRQILECAGIDGKRLGFWLISEVEGKGFTRLFSNYARELKKVRMKEKKRVASGGRK